MDQVTRVRKYIKREQWKTLIHECQSSGMTVTAWCKANDICEQTYYRNLKALREELCNNLPASLPETCDKPVAFAKLEVATPLPDTKAAVIIRLPASRQYRQYFSHCRVYVRRYHSCRKCLYRLWIHRHEKVHRRTCCGCKRAVPSGPFL